MPKLTGPLFSVEAHKDLAKALTYQRRPGGASVYGYKKPRVPLSDLQVQQRSLIAAATGYWHSLTDDQKAEWEVKAKGQGQSGYSYCISQYCKLNFDRPLWLPFNEGSGLFTADRSGHGNNGTIVGASWVAGQYGHALSFDGEDNYVSCLNNGGSLTLNGDFTVECLVKPLDTGVAQIIVGKARLWWSTLEWCLMVDGSKFRAGICNGVDTSLVDSDKVYSTEWHHLALRREGIDLAMFVNGAIQADTETITGDIDPGGLLYIGRREVSNSYNLHGLVEEVSTCTRALGAGTIKRHSERRFK